MRDNAGLKQGVMGLFGSRKDRRSGKDRRIRIDPRYRSAAYPEFVDRRKADRRILLYGGASSLTREHPIPKWVFLIGAVVSIFLIYVFFFTCLIVRNKCPDTRARKRTITLGYYQGLGGTHAAANTEHGLRNIGTKDVDTPFGIC
jgi:hypothetical protein